jgi:thioredoxin-dependent peroxiredoxin
MHPTSKSSSPRALARALSATALLAVSGITAAALDVGAPAPAFTAPATLGGKAFTFALADELKKGPVIVYFYPAAFTGGCTAEAHEFAANVDAFKAEGAEIIGISKDDIDTLHKFSVSECGGKFPVASDPDLKISKAYDATMMLWPGHSDRTSYVVTPDGKIYSAYSALSPSKHVQSMLTALKEWRAKQAKPASAP